MRGSVLYGKDLVSDALYFLIDEKMVIAIVNNVPKRSIPKLLLYLDPRPKKIFKSEKFCKSKRRQLLHSLMLFLISSVSEYRVLLNILFKNYP